MRQIHLFNSFEPILKLKVFMKSFFLLFCLLISFSSVVAQKTNKVDNSTIIDGYKNQFRNAKSL